MLHLHQNVGSTLDEAVTVGILTPLRLQFPEECETVEATLKAHVVLDRFNA